MGSYGEAGLAGLGLGFNVSGLPPAERASKVLVLTEKAQKMKRSGIYGSGV